ncbi:hypothetical protein TNCV_1614691 [Trichonephila clavipes]|nr:hypothetical protein TNCV_1614691 [Trichonephila clavipes]
MKIGNNSNLVLGPFDESTPLDDRFCLQFFLSWIFKQAKPRSFRKIFHKVDGHTSIPVLDGGLTHSSSLNASLYSSNSFFCTYRTWRLWGCELSIRVNVVRKHSMVNQQLL